MAIYGNKKVVLYSRGLESWEFIKEISLNAATAGEIVDLIPLNSTFVAFTTKGIHKMNEKNTGFEESLELSNIK